MDELLQHCIRELAFEGDLGCDASRLRDFISDYHKQTESSQKVDDAYCAFVWSIVAQQPEVRVGTAPEGAPEVYIAPQFSKRDKAKTTAEEYAAQSSLTLIPDAATKSLDELSEQYGDALRIAVDPERSFVALTGSHIKPSSLTPPVYTCLQLIARGRENGLSSVDLSSKTTYDAKTCHYLISKLVAMNVVIKLKKSGVGTNFCIHKYFFEKSEKWKAVLAEEEEATKDDSADEAQDDGDDDEGDVKPGRVRFDPIDVHHLSRISLVRARLEKLLKNCPNHTHKALNLLVAIGFSNPKKTERRFFQARLRELEGEGFIETIQVRRPNGKYVKCVRLVDAAAGGDDSNEEAKATGEPEQLEGVQHSVKTTMTIQRQMLDIVHGGGTEGVTLNQIADVLGNFDKRVLDFQINHLREPPPPPHLHHLGIEQIGETHGRERRYKYYTHDHYVVVAERERLDRKFPENYFDLAGEFAAAEADQFYEDTNDFNHFVDSYGAANGEASTKTKKSSKPRTEKDTSDGKVPPKRGKKRKLDEVADGESVTAPVPGQPKKRGRPPKYTSPGAHAGDGDAAQGSVSAPVVPRKRGRPRKHPLPDDSATPKKRGRPRKHPQPDAIIGDAVDAVTPSTSVVVHEPLPGAVTSTDPATAQLPLFDSTTAAVENSSVAALESISAPVPKKRGRPRKGTATVHAVLEHAPAEASVAAAAQGSGLQRVEPTPTAESVSAPVKKRGRPRKNPPPDAPSVAVADTVAPTAADPQPSVEPALSAPKRRGRPPKVKTPQDKEAEEAAKAPKKRGRPPKKLQPQEQDVAASREDEASDADRDGLEEHPEVTARTVASGRDNPSTQSHVSASAASQVDETGSVDVAANLPTEFIDASASPATEGRPLNAIEAAPDTPIAIDPALLEDEASAVAAPPMLPLESTSTTRPPSELPTKRPLPESSSAPSTSKRLKGDWSANYRSRTNITQSRRQKEVLQVLKRVGGIINSSSRELYDEHTAEIEALTKAGEATSTLAGSRIDKRTMTATLDELESQGKIKVLKSMITSSTGVTRQVKIVYLSDTPQEKVTEFLSGFTYTPPVQSAFIPLPSIKIVDEVADYGGSRSSKVSQHPASVILLDQGPRDHDPERAAKLLRADDDTTRASLLTEPNTVVQQYGFVVGKVARVRELHMHVMRVLEEQSSPAILSTEKHIIRLSHFTEELPVSVYAAVVSCRVPNDELLQLLATPEGRRTPLRDLSQEIQEAFDIHKARSRTRMLDNLGLLETLGLVVPLREAAGDAQPFITCGPNSDHPTSFERTVCESGATSVAPQYWMFNRTAPLFMWALDDQYPPFYRDVPVTTTAEAQHFWGELQRISLDAEFCKKLLQETPAPQHPSPHVPSSVVKLLRRQTQWSTAYNFSWFQKQYLKKYIDVATATTPLQDEDHGVERLTQIASVVSAPWDQVVRFYEHEHARLAKDIKRLKGHRRDRTKSKEEHKAALAQKAADAKAKRERDWDEMIARVHPEPLKGTFASRVRAVRHKFMSSSGRDMSKWEEEVRKAIQEAKLPTARSRPAFPSIPLHPLPTPPPLALNSNEKSVDDIIASQIPLMEKKPAPKPNKGKGKEKAKGKGKGKEKEKAEDEKQRRARFLWNKDLDELARDSAAIIRARCRGKRVQWAALEQVFPASTANSVRQRVLHILELPGQASYMKRLEDRWSELWVRHLGTPELPDEDPGSPTNFDLKAHVKFLRSHIDKNALRMGLVQTEKPDGLALPGTVHALHEKWDVVEKPMLAPSWDFLWTGLAEEGREKQMLHQTFTMEGSEVPEFRQYPTEAAYVADTALKMTLGTPNDVYDVERASQLLHGVDKDAYNIAARDLQERNVVSMLVRDPKKSKPGRPLKISDQNQNALGGSFVEDLYQDACAMEELVAQTEEDTSWREWPLLASDGDMAALVELVSDGKLDFKIDTSHAQSVRAALDWNSKKADDDDIETAISFRYTGATAEQPASPSAQDVTMQEPENPPLPEIAVGSTHGRTTDGEIACCAVLSNMGIVDCADCLTVAAESLLVDLQPEENQLYRTLLDALEDAGPEGLTKEELQKIVTRQVLHKLPECIARLTNGSPSLAFWAGNKDVVLVSSHYASVWSVLIEQDDAKCVRVLPRRWLNIWGGVMPDVWAAACRAVMGIVHFHPGIPQTELRWRLKAVYDRQEVHDVLQHLLGEGFLRRDVRTQSALGVEGPPSNAEERAILWSTNSGKRWYQVILQH